MSTEITIKAESRVPATKGAVKKQRKAGVIPGIVYGRNGSKAINLVVKSLPKGHTKTQVLKLDVEGSTKSVLMREVQVNPLSDLPIHIDFQEVSPTDVVTVRVPLEFVGLTREQEKEGSFKILLRSLQVKAVVSKLPASMKVNVGDLKLDESAHIADLEVPEGIKVMAVRSLALASLVKL